MEKLRRKLPPLSSLVAFEAAARLRSFSAAAGELNVSREAVSRQIRALETYLGAALFSREANSVDLNRLGERYFTVVGPNLSAIAMSTQEVMNYEASEADDPESPSLQDQLEHEANDDLPRRRILVVDDQTDNIKHLYGLLKDEFTVVAETSGQGALSYLSRNLDVDLILMDVCMPKMDGYETCRQLKSSASTGDIPVIFVTSLDEPQDEMEGLNAGGGDFLSRPIVPAVMKRRIWLQIELRETRMDLERLLQTRTNRLQEAETLMQKIVGDMTQFRSKN